ncbi:MAG: xanthine dehydrogenase family protein molybdopterin-binding subunit, partial [Solirubrobacterales bacterium]
AGNGAAAGTAQPKLMGARVKRVEDPRFLTGQGRFVDDFAPAGQRHIAFVRSTEAHADITAIDTSAAEQAEGVHEVIVGADLAGLTLPITCNSMYPSWQKTEFHALSPGRVRFAGEAVAAVIAEDRYLAEDAAELVEVSYEPLEPVPSIAAATREGAPRLHAGWEDNFYVKRHVSIGEPDDAFASAHGTLEVDLHTKRHSGIPIENRGVVAEYDRADEVLTLWTSTQIPHLVRTGLADFLQIPENRIRVIGPEVGGGFGIKAHLFPEEIAVAWIAMRSDRPVKWIEDRREHLLASIHAREHEHHLEVAYEDDGTVTAVRAKLFIDCGAYSVYPWTSTMDTGMALGILPGPYRIRHYECEAYSVTTNKCPLGPYRGVSRPQACFSIERAMDEVARALDMDPLDVRRKNTIQSDEFPYESITGLNYDSGSMAESLEKVLELSDYEGLREQQSEARAEGRYLGIGFSHYTEQMAHATQEFIKRGVPIVFGFDSATVRMDPSGKVLVNVSTHNHGQGHETTYAQVVADELAVPLEDVRVVFGDTSSAPYGHGTFASRSAVLAGGAAIKAAREVREMLVDFAAKELEASAADLEVGEGQISIKGSPQSSVAIADLARWAYWRPEKLPDGMQSAIEAVAAYDADPGTGTFTNAALIALVEVDPNTGGVKALGVWIVEDCGQMINPLVVDGQVHGGVAQGLGGALLEEMVYDEAGNMKTTTLLDYRLPGSTDIPHIEVDHISTPSPFTIEGIKGMGEGGAIGPGPAIAAAVQDALRPLGDVFVNELPLTPERVRRFARIAEGAAGG